MENKNIHKIGKELFITSDEEIKEGDWVYYLHNSGLHKPRIMEVIKPNYSDYKPYSIHFKSGFGVQEDCKKIILTTDQDLIKDGVQAIDDEFLEWFVKNPSCEEFTYEEYMSGKYLIPKEEPKQYPKTFKELFANTGIEPTTDESGNTVYNFKATMKEEPKQRLEKYSERFDNDKSAIGNTETWGKRMIDDVSKEESKNLKNFKKLVSDEVSPAMKDFIAGAKWQQEQILDFLYEEITERRDYSASKMCEKVIEFIEKFKNK